MNLIVRSFGDIVIVLDEFATFFYMVIDKLGGIFLSTNSNANKEKLVNLKLLVFEL